MASMQSSKGCSNRAALNMNAPLSTNSQKQWNTMTNAAVQKQAANPIGASATNYCQQVAFENSIGGQKGLGDGAYVKIEHDELKPSNSSSFPYQGPHKIVASVPIELQMTNAQKLQADKDQLKLNLQNFRKKTAKQIQKAKQEAALQAQNSSGLNSTYQAFDLQNYKTRKSVCDPPSVCQL